MLTGPNHIKLRCVDANSSSQTNQHIAKPALGPSLCETTDGQNSLAGNSNTTRLRLQPNPALESLFVKKLGYGPQDHFSSTPQGN